MFDIGWSELVVIGVVALIAIGPKELPGVLRTVGQWMGKVRRMAAEFQGQFNEAMREAEMADLKKSFDEIKDTASSFSKNNLLTSLGQDVSESLKIDDIDKPATPPTPSSAPAADAGKAEASPGPSEVDLPSATESDQAGPKPAATALPEAQTHGAAAEPLAITREAAQAAPAADAGHDAPPAAHDLHRDVKAS